MDATKRFPLPSEAFDYVFSEHIIEHISYDSGRAMLQECFRVLKPGGKVRISTPDLTVLLGLHRSPRSEMQERYIEWAISNFIPNATATRECFVINNAFRNWGHTFICDKPSLEHLVRSVGFSGITWHEPHASDDPQLRGIETHGAADRRRGDQSLRSHDPPGNETVELLLGDLTHPACSTGLTASGCGLLLLQRCSISAVDLWEPYGSSRRHRPDQQLANALQAGLPPQAGP